MKIKGFIAVSLAAAMLCMLVFCACTEQMAPSDPTELTDIDSVSLSRLQDAMSLDEVHAAALLDLLAQMDFSGEVLFSYPATDDNAVTYYHIWIGERTVDVYMNTDGTVAAVQTSGVLCYGEVPLPSEQPKEDKPSEDAPSISTLTLDHHTAQVEAGKDGCVSVFGMPGVEYKIKVYYAGGVSTAKALSPQIAAEDGSLIWEWTVSSRAKPGVYKIEVVRADDEQDKLTLPFEVTEKSEE